MNSLSLSHSIDLIIGPMYAGKSTELIRRLMIYYEMDMKVLYINSSHDNRSQQSFSTHNETIGKIPYDSIKVKNLSECDVNKYDVVGIDESQMFNDLKEYVLDWADKQNKIVIVCGLNGDFRRQPFGQINDLVSHCDSITKLTPFCLLCKRNASTITAAHFTKRIVEDQSTVLIGGKDMYVPVCRKCYSFRNI